LFYLLGAWHLTRTYYYTCVFAPIPIILFASLRVQYRNILLVISNLTRMNVEYMDNGSLDRMLKKYGRDRINNRIKLNIMRGIAEGMNHLAKHNIVHRYRRSSSFDFNIIDQRDLAARNILLTSNFDAKIRQFIHLNLRWLIFF
jgi:hypothetical protein